MIKRSELSHVGRSHGELADHVRGKSRFLSSIFRKLCGCIESIYLISPEDDSISVLIMTYTCATQMEEFRLLQCA